MASLPLSLVCFKCFTRFDSHIEFDENAHNVNLINCKALCPVCHQRVYIADGVYSFESVALSAAQRANARERAALSEALGPTWEGDGYDAASVLRSLSKINGTWDALATFVRTNKRSDWAAFINVILNVVKLVVS